MNPNVYDTPERLDAGLEKAMNGFTQQALETVRHLWVKTVTLHGFAVKFTDDRENQVPHIRVNMPDPPVCGNCHPAAGMGPGMNYYYDTDDDASKARAFNAAMSWADKMAFGYSVMNAALSALTTEPDLIAETKDYEPWTTLAEQCIDLHVSPDSSPVKDGMYSIDITAMMDSPEIGPNMGGVWNVPVSGDLSHTDTSIPVRCELTLCFNAGGRWIALYDVSEVI